MVKMFSTLVVATLLQTGQLAATAAIRSQTVAEDNVLQAVRMEYQPGAIESTDTHEYDEVLVPLTTGMSINLEGKPVEWTVGVAILVPRGARHQIQNSSNAVVTFVLVRRNGGTVLPGEQTDPHGVTLVRAEEGEYVRTETFRFEADSQLWGIGTRQAGPTVFVLTSDASVRMTIASTISQSGSRPSGTVWLFEPGMAYGLANLSSVPFEAVAISATGR